MRLSWIRTSVLLVTSLGVSQACWGDDGAIEAVGGVIRLMKDHPSIQMVSEFVHARIGPSRVETECVFFLSNSGEATTVTVGFPCTSSGADVSRTTPFKEFYSYVDGKSVAVREVPDYSFSDQFRSWWVKDVNFKAGEYKCLREVYVAEPGHTAPNDRFFEYELSTGSSWAGKIGVGEIVFSLEGISPDSLFYMDPQPTSRTAGELRWYFSDLEPTPESGISRIVIAWHGKLR